MLCGFAGFSAIIGFLYNLLRYGGYDICCSHVIYVTRQKSLRAKIYLDPGCIDSQTGLSRFVDTLRSSLHIAIYKTNAEIKQIYGRRLLQFRLVVH